MAHLSRKHSKTASFVAFAATLPLAAHATDSELKVTQLPTITVQAEQIKNSYLAPKSSSTKRTEAILDTAKTVQVITEKALKDQGLLSLQQALATTPPAPAASERNRVHPRA